MAAPLSDDDKAFIRAILDHPDELTTWLAYADWLDDRGDPRSEFLRLTAERRTSSDEDRTAAIDARLEELRAQLDPNWMLVFETAALANCRGAGWAFRCPLNWNQLAPTDTPDIRICHTCKSPVFFCHTIEEARQFASSGQCVALSSRISAEQQAELAPPIEDEVEFMGLMMDPAEESDLQPPEPPAPPKPWWKFW
jgi:uncharacterized protein (TIGR02996 family)